MTEVILAVIRAVFVVMFGMNVAVICTWVDRRQGALIQDRVGPDRAVIWLPTTVARALALLVVAGAALTRAGTYPVAFVSDDADVDTRYVKLAVGPRTATP